MLARQITISSEMSGEICDSVNNLLLLKLNGSKNWALLRLIQGVGLLDKEGYWKRCGIGLYLQIGLWHRKPDSRAEKL